MSYVLQLCKVVIVIQHSSIEGATFLCGNIVMMFLYTVQFPQIQIKHSLFEEVTCFVMFLHISRF